jgi:hypothetical protein
MQSDVHHAYPPHKRPSEKAYASIECLIRCKFASLINLTAQMATTCARSAQAAKPMPKV